MKKGEKKGTADDIRLNRGSPVCVRPSRKRRVGRTSLPLAFTGESVEMTKVMS